MSGGRPAHHPGCAPPLATSFGAAGAKPGKNQLLCDAQRRRERRKGGRKREGRKKMREREWKGGGVVINQVTKPSDIGICPR